MPETVSNVGSLRRFEDLRGVQWRIDLGILPSSFSASIDDLRRLTANSRRRYASLRRQLLVDPHVLKDGSSSPELVMDNPLSQNPDSMWGRFFKNAELERMLDQDLTRLYPERGSYFQTSGCQGMLRRILLLWCLRHPEYGYRQGMHELLAPLVYVLHIDVMRLVEVRKCYEDHFADKFDAFSFHENDFTYKFDFKKFSESEEDKIGFKTSTKATSPSELDPEIQTIVLLSDAYGAEGELGVILSDKFMEHDAYSMFDSLMSGAGGAVAMAEFYSPSPFINFQSGLPPVIEASAALYHLLSTADSSLHSHLVELGVEPQYFALRWLRVLFGREFTLEDLLLIWDEIFSRDNSKICKSSGSDAESNFRALDSPRGAFISAFAVSMILNLRSALLATENATTCLQRLLNFPDEVSIAKLIAKAASLQPLALQANANSHQIQHGLHGGRKAAARGHSLSLDFTTSKIPLDMVHESYWEEKWRVLHTEGESQKDVHEKHVNRKKGWSDRVRLSLSRTESVPCPSMKHKVVKDPKSCVRRNLLDDLAKQLGPNEGEGSVGSDEGFGSVNPMAEGNEQNPTDDGEQNSPNFSEPPGPARGNSDDQEDEFESSVASNSSVDENDSEISNNGSCEPNLACSPVPALDPLSGGHSSTSAQQDHSIGKSTADVKQTKLLSGKFQWLWKLRRHAGEAATSECSPDGARTNKGESCDQRKESDFPTDRRRSLGSTSNGDTVDQNTMVSMRNLGQAMAQNIQVIESVFQQNRGEMGSLEKKKNDFSAKGGTTALAALDELRKISNLLSEM